MFKADEREDDQQRMVINLLEVTAHSPAWEP